MRYLATLSGDPQRWVVHIPGVGSVRGHSIADAAHKAVLLVRRAKDDFDPEIELVVSSAVLADTAIGG